MGRLDIGYFISIVSKGFQTCCLRAQAATLDLLGGPVFPGQKSLSEGSTKVEKLRVCCRVQGHVSKC